MTRAATRGWLLAALVLAVALLVTSVTLFATSVTGTAGGDPRGPMSSRASTWMMGGPDQDDADWDDGGPAGRPGRPADCLDLMRGREGR